MVPQCRGILNISLAFPCDDAPGDIAEHWYASLCDVLATPLNTMGIRCAARAVEGSFCDGRFNLAVLEHSDITCRKVAGTAQYWKRSGGHQAVLLHALLVADADPGYLTQVANQFETDLDSGRTYQTSALTNVASHVDTAAFSEKNQITLLETLTDGLFSAISS